MAPKFVSSVSPAWRWGGRAEVPEVFSPSEHGASIGRSNTLAVATDQSAAPGLLAEVAITAAQLAVQQLAETALPPPARTRACRAGIDIPTGQ